MDSAALRRLFPRLAGHLSEAETKVLVARLTENRFATGERLSTFGEDSGTLHFVTHGMLNVHVVEDGEDLLLGQAAAGAMVGEVGLIEPGPASATVAALEPSVTLSLGRQDLDDLSQEHPAVASALLLALSHELVGRLRRSGSDIVRRIDDHHWMRAEAKRDRKGWLRRLADLVHGAEGGNA